MVYPEEDQLDDLTNKAVRAILKDVINKLDDLSCEDFFGTEGWRHWFAGMDVVDYEEDEEDETDT